MSTAAAQDAAPSPGAAEPEAYPAEPAVPPGPSFAAPPLYADDPEAEHEFDDDPDSALAPHPVIAALLRHIRDG